MFLYSSGSGVYRVQFVLPGFSVRLICFVQAKTVCRYGCMYFFAALLLLLFTFQSGPSQSSTHVSR